MAREGDDVEGLDEEFQYHLSRGSDLLGRGNAEGALEPLERGLALRPRDPKVLALLGQAHYRVGRFEAAAVAWRRLVDDNPAEAGARVNLGLALLKARTFPEAIRQLEIALDLNPDHRKAMGYLGLALLESGDALRARAWFERAGSDQMVARCDEALAALGLPVPPRQTVIPPRALSPLLPPLGVDLGDNAVVEPAEGHVDEPSTGDQGELIGAGTGEYALAPAPAAPPPPAPPSATLVPSDEPDYAEQVTMEDEGPATMPVVLEEEPAAAPAPTEEAGSLSDALAEAAEARPVRAPEPLASVVEAPPVEPPPPQPAPVEPPPVEAPAAEARRIVPAPLHGPPLEVGLEDWAEARLLRPTLIAPFAASGGSLAVRVQGELRCRLSGLLAWRGDLKFQGVVKRFRGRATGKPFGEGTEQVHLISGEGLLVLGAPGRHFTVVDLTGGSGYFREGAVFAFEEPITFENGRLPSAGGDLHLVHLKGRGRVVVVAGAEPVSVAVTALAPLRLHIAALVGWTGALKPTLVPLGDGGAEGTAVELLGEGRVLLDPAPAVAPSVSPATALGQAAP